MNQNPKITPEQRARIISNIEHLNRIRTDEQQLRAAIVSVSKEPCNTIEVLRNWLQEFKSLKTRTQEYVDFANQNYLSMHYSDAHKNLLSIYEEIEELSILQERESYFEQELVALSEYKEDPFFVKEWLAVNRILGTDEYLCFMLNYLDYRQDPEPVHLSIYSGTGISIYADRKDFVSIIEFVRTFMKLYKWE